jgi:hypothetical protein
MNDEDLTLLWRKQPKLVRRDSGDSLGSRQRGHLHLELITFPLE